MKSRTVLLLCSTFYLDILSSSIIHSFLSSSIQLMFPFSSIRCLPHFSHVDFHSSKTFPSFTFDHFRCCAIQQHVPLIDLSFILVNRAASFWRTLFRRQSSPETGVFIEDGLHFTHVYCVPLHGMLNHCYSSLFSMRQITCFYKRTGRTVKMERHRQATLSYRRKCYEIWEDKSPHFSFSCYHTQSFLVSVAHSKTAGKETAAFSPNLVSKS